MPNLMKTLTIGSGTYEICDAAAREALEKKVNKEDGKGLSTCDYDNAAKAKVDAIPEDPKYTDTVTLVDATLKNEGESADAKATGDALNQLKDDFVANCKHINIFDYRNAGIFKGYIDADSHLVEDVTSLHIAYIHVIEGEIYTINRLSDSYKRFLIYSCAGDPMPNTSVTLLKGAGFENHNGRDYGRAIIPNGHNRLLIAYYHKTYDTVDSDTLLRDIVVYEGREIIDGFIPYNTLNVEKYNLLPEYQNMPIDVAELKSDLAELKRKTKVIVPESIIQEDWAPMCYAVEGKYLYAGCNTMSIYKYDMSCSWNPERVAALNPAVLISQFEPSSKFGQYRGAAFGIAVCHDLVYVAWRVMSGGLTDYDTETYLGFMSVLSCNDLSIVKIIKLPYKCTGLSIYGNYLVLSHHFDGFSVWDIGGDNASNPNKIAEWSVASRDTEIEWQNCGIEENYDGNLIITFAKYYDGIQSYLFNTTTKTITEFDALHLADIAELCDGNEKVHSVYNVVVDNGMVYGALSTGFSQKHNTELDHRGIIYGTIGNLMSTYKIVKISDSDRPPLLSSGDPAPSRIVKVGDTIITNLDSCGFAIFCKNGSEYEYIGKSSAPLTDPELSTSGGMYADNTGKIIATQNKYASSAQKNQVIATYKIAEIVN